MSLKQLNPRTTVLLVFMVATAAIRILFSMDPDITPIATFTPLGAMALFSGAYFSKGFKAYFFTIITLWLGDVILNRFAYYQEWKLLYEGFYWTYGSFALMVLLGQKLFKKVTVANVILASFIATLIHWIGTSPGCFMIANSMYPKTWGGYLTSLVAAIPYEWNFLVGTLAYGTVLFGGFELLKRRYTSLQVSA